MKTNKLHTIKKTGFKIPEDYLASLEHTILSEIKLQESIPNSGFKVPNNYFDSLDNKLMNAILQQEDTKVIKLFTWRKVVYAVAVAASLFLTINLFFNKPTPVSLADLETASLENYFINEDLEMAEFTSLFTKEDLQNVQLITDGYSSEHLEKFLFENLEIEDIITK